MTKSNFSKYKFPKAILVISALLFVLFFGCKENNDSFTSSSVEVKNDSLKTGLYKTVYDEYDVHEEFRIVNGEEYVNRVWYTDRKGDTLYDKGNFFTVQLPDTSTVNEIISIKIFLEKPFFGYRSRLLLFPDDQADTIFNVAESTDENLRAQLKEAPTNLMLIHNVRFLSPGEKTIKAVLKELDTARVEGELVEKERIMYLEERIFITDKKG